MKQRSQKAERLSSPPSIRPEKHLSGLAGKLALLAQSVFISIMAQRQNRLPELHI